MTARLPLAGIRVLDLTISWAGPHATMLLADMGAEVLKMEAIQRPDIIRGALEPRGGVTSVYPDHDPGERPWNRSAFFNSINRNKRDFCLNLKDPAGVALFERLVAISDVVAESFTADVMDRFGLGYERLTAIKPDIIMLSMPAFGSTGPYRGYSIFGHATEAIALQKLLRAYGPSERPMGTPVAWGDPITGATAAFAVLAALVHRRSSGHGQRIDLSHVEALLPLLGEVIADYSLNGRTATPVGNRHPNMAPHGVYPAAGVDRWLAIAVRTDADWRALCGVIGRPELAADPRFADLAARQRHHNELDGLLANWSVRWSPLASSDRLQAAGVPAAPVQDAADVSADRQLRARNFFQVTGNADAGQHEYVGLPFRLSATPLAVRSGSPTLGQDNRYVFQELLGLDDTAFADLEARAITGTRPIGAA